MKASLNLLRQYVDLSGLTPEEIAHKLTFSGLEVEGIERLCEATNLVIGQIIACDNHPNSDHLHVLKVNLGEKYGVKQIVCGAPNARVGLKVIVAMVGAELKANNIKIVKSTIRGVESEGMCCALFELGVDKLFLSEKQINGIEELDDDAVVGNENVLEYLGLDDVIFDINVLANRSDCLAIFSLAYEIGSLFNRKVSIPQIEKYNELPSFLEATSLTDDCNQFSIKAVTGVKVKESPKWLKSYLRSQGIRAINNIVDIGNFVMILTGQPLHMYDIDKLSTNKFVVRNDFDGDFVALDDKTYSIKNGDIVICNGDQIGCLGGIMGAKGCAIDDNTTNIAIESAYFNGSTVRRTTIRTGLSSDSSARFIKGICPHQDQFVLDLVTKLLIDLAEAKDVYQTTRYDNSSEEKKAISCSYSYINKRLGTSFTNELIKETLTALRIEVNDLDDDKFIAYPPLNRIDLKCDADLSEEVIRFIGLDKITPTLPKMVTTIGGLNEHQDKRKKIREHLINEGLFEVLTYTLVSPSLDQKLVLLNNDEGIKIKNPMTVEHFLVRRGLVSSLLDTLNYNVSHQNKNVPIFEVSEVTTSAQQYEELAILLHGNKLERGHLKTRPYDFYDAMGLFKSICQLLGVEAKRYRLEREVNSKELHPGRSVKVIFGNKVVGVIAQMHPNISENKEIFIVDLNLTEFLNVKSPKSKMVAISRYPSVERDYALVVENSILAMDLIKIIRKEAHGIISDVNIFDVYEGEFLQKNYKSIAIKVTFSSIEKTLRDEEINEVESKFLNALNKQFKAVLRG